MARFLPIAAFVLGSVWLAACGATDEPSRRLPVVAPAPAPAVGGGEPFPAASASATPAAAAVAGPAEASGQPALSQAGERPQQKSLPSLGDPVPVEVVSLAKATTRTDWCTVAVPAALVPQEARSGTFGEGDWPAVVGRRLGSHSVLVHIECRELAPGQRVSGSLRFADTEPPEFEPDPWADAEDLAPWPVLALPNRGAGAGSVTERSVRGRAQLQGLQRELVHEDGAERITRLQLRLVDEGTRTPLFWRVWVYQYRHSPVARWDAQLVHSDSTSAAMALPIQSLAIESVQPHLVDHGWSLGAGKLEPPTGGRGQWRTLLLGSCSLADGVRPTWTGVSMSSPRAGAGIHPRQELRLAAARAATEGPIVASVGVGVWDGHWLALERTPAVPGSSPWAAGVAAHERWLEAAQRRSGYWADRYLAMDKFPGRTGAQPNHGIVRGGEIVSTGCPLPLDGYAMRLTSHLRPTAYYEPSMELVTGETHPEWRTWQGRTFVRDEFRDSLGKVVGESGQLDRPQTEGWQAPDEQHYGHLELCAYYALTGRLFARQLMRELTEVWLVAFHELEGRGIGRSWLDMATIHRLTGDVRIVEHIERVFERDMAGWYGQIRGPVKVWPRFNDPRALRTAGGESVDCAVVWQIGLMAPGLEAARRVTRNEAIGKTLRLNVEALIQCGWFRSPNGQWMEVDYWWFRNGRPPVEEDYGQDGNVAGRTHRTGWFGDWVAYATLLGQKVLTGDLREKARAIATARYDTRPDDWVSAQWRLPVDG